MTLIQISAQPDVFVDPLAITAVFKDTGRRDCTVIIDAKEFSAPAFTHIDALLAAVNQAHGSPMMLAESHTDIAQEIQVEVLAKSVSNLSAHLNELASETDRRLVDLRKYAVNVDGRLAELASVLDGRIMKNSDSLAELRGMLTTITSEIRSDIASLNERLDRLVQALVVAGQ